MTSLGRRIGAADDVAARPVRLATPPGLADSLDGEDAQLTHLGVAPAEEAAYRIALQRSAWTMSEFTARLGVPGGKAAEIVAKLVDLDLLHTSADGDRLRPVNPQLGLTALIARREAEMVSSWHELERSRLSAANLAADFDSAQYNHIDSALDAAHGPEAVRARIAALVSQARTEVVSIMLSGAGYVDPVSVPRRADLAGLAAGVRFRTVAADRARQDPLTLRHLHGAAVDGVQVRTAAEVPMSALVVDAGIAVFPLAPSQAPHRPSVVVLRLPSVVVTTLELFERLWAVATPLDEATEGRDALTDRQRQLLTLLLAGSTDESAACRLGVSIRTVRRMVAELNDRLGARGRFQAGALAAERGWINPQMLRGPEVVDEPSSLAR
ncbi:MAG TPA: LuxR C-terminal-related transcriptional regulator [Pseudonocardiaceae bacterium]|nr:LuxR C-terminal-related transcriptional regulator [Pseudonocardiaceae bacterium]